MDGIRIEGLVKQYPRSNDLFQFLRHPLRRERVVALDGIDLQINRGGIYALLGPNGAGKTTLLKVLAGLLLPNAGRFLIDGEDLTDKPVRIREQVGFVVCDERSFYWRLSALENLRFFATLNGFPKAEREARIQHCLARVGLTENAQWQFMSLSTGMRQKLAIARGLLLEPSILLMDEPTRSLDPESTARIHEVVQGILDQDQERIILYSTHNLKEAETISGHVIVIRKGRIAMQQSLGQKDRREQKVYRLCTSPPVRTDALEGWPGIQVLEQGEKGLTLRVEDLAALDHLVDGLRSQDVHILELSRKRSSVLDLYMRSGEEGGQHGISETGTAAGGQNE